MKKTYLQYEQEYDKIVDAIYDNDTERGIELITRYPFLTHVHMYGNRDDKSLLHVAALKGNEEISKVLLANGADINAFSVTDGYITPLVGAIYREHLNMVNFLCANGALIDGNPECPTTPLIVAVQDSLSDIISSLLSYNPDINRLHSNRNRTALDYAIRLNDAGIIELLKSHGAKTAFDDLSSTIDRAQGIYECIYETGYILASDIYSRMHGNFKIDLRTALLGKGDRNKLLFTIGAYEEQPRNEFLLVLPYNWILNKAVLESDNRYGFPLNLLFKLASYRLDGNTLEEGYAIEKTDPYWSSLQWPTGIDAFILLDYPFPDDDDSQTEEIDEDTVTLLLLSPIKYSKKGLPKRKAMQDWIAKKRQLKWHRHSLVMPEES